MATCNWKEERENHQVSSEMGEFLQKREDQNVDSGTAPCRISALDAEHLQVFCL